MINLAEISPPGEFVREELEARGWTQADLAEIMGRPVETVNRLVTAKLAITPDTARALSAAFGTSAELWLNLEAAYQLASVDTDASIARRARLYGMAPIKDMIRRKWIESSSNVEVLEHQVVRFFDLKDINSTPSLSIAARKSTTYENTSPEQIAWYYRARQLASEVEAKPYSKCGLVNALGELRALATHPNEVRRVPSLLAELGVRLIIVQHLPKSKIDGVAFWLDKARSKMPAIALSIRYDRIDGFWHTLGHELGHILERDRLVVDLNLVGDTDKRDDRPETEKRADRFACNLLIPDEELDDFIVRVRPLYSKKRIVGFANRIRVHPGIVVGQLQHRGEIGFSHSREMLVKVRDIATGAALTDGWGHLP